MDHDSPEHHPQEDDASYEERVEKLVTMTVGAAKGIIPPGQISLLLLQIANGTAAPPEIRAFTLVLLQLIKGERDPDIGSHLPPGLAEATKEAIDRIEAPLPVEDEGEAEGLTLSELLERVGEACTGNVILWQQLWDFTETLETAPTTPPDIKTLAVVLRKILAGERQKHIVEVLPPQLAEPVSLLLDQLVQQSTH